MVSPFWSCVWLGWPSPSVVCRGRARVSFAPSHVDLITYNGCDPQVLHLFNGLKAIFSGREPVAEAVALPEHVNYDQYHPTFRAFPSR